MRRILFFSFYLLVFTFLGAQTLKTPWAEKVDKQCPRPEYPRPILQRAQWLCLNGQWDYAILDKGCVEPSEWDGKITVPFCVESQLSGVQKPLTEKQELWYHREFEVPAGWKGRRVMLNFGAVDWQADVYVNDIHVGGHRGGYAAFSFDITPYLLSKGQQKLVVRVYDPTNRGYQPVGKQTLTPHSIWYTAVSGIWQTVWLEPVAQNHITHIAAAPDVYHGSVELTLRSSADNDGSIVEAVLTEGDKKVASAKGMPNGTLRMKVPDARLWSPDHPFLYGLKLTLRKDGKVQDEVKSYVAMRTIEIGRGKDESYVRMRLNGRNCFQYGPLDQGWYPDGLYTAATEEAMRYDLEVVKQLGYNMIRKHVKVEPDRWYYLCDSLGILVWQGMPSGDYGNQWEPGKYNGGTDRQRSTASAENYHHEWKEIVDQCGQHPCVVVWVPFNEGWGQFETEKVVAWTKEYDPTRLVNPASGGNHRACGDIFDLHNYPQPSMYLSDPNRVNVLGEYGGIGLPMAGHLWKEDQNWGYVKFQNKDEVTEEYVKYAEQLKGFVERGYSAAVYTQMSDVEGEVNGLLTYDRRELKVDPVAVGKVNREVIAILNNKQNMELFTLKNRHGMTARITNYGGRIVSLLVPDREGRMQDVVLGFDNTEDYLRENHLSDFGAAIGRYANRLGDGRITVAGKTIQLPQNNGRHTLHGGPTGWQYQLFTVESVTANSLTLTLVSPDGDNNFPGEVHVRMVYTLTDDNTLDVNYSATTDAPTVINMTNHSYFNLNGDGRTTILNHLLTIDADQYTPIDDSYLPLGVKEPVEGTPFDFRRAKAVGKEMDADNVQLRNGNGYDHNWVLNTRGNVEKPCARLESPTTGIVLEVFTTEPGMQVYTGNFLDGTVKGKGGVAYPQRSAICLETQKYPDSPNRQWAESNAYLNPGETYQSRTRYRFSCQK